MGKVIPLRPRAHTASRSEQPKNSEKKPTKELKTRTGFKELLDYARFLSETYGIAVVSKSFDDYDGDYGDKYIAVVYDSKILLERHFQIAASTGVTCIHIFWL